VKVLSPADSLLLMKYGTEPIEKQASAPETETKSADNGKLRPVLCAVIYAQNFDSLLLHAVNSDIGQGREENFSGAFLASGLATIRRLSQ
jgi:hypothetical protein